MFTLVQQIFFATVDEFIYSGDANNNGDFDEQRKMEEEGHARKVFHSCDDTVAVEVDVYNGK